MTYDKPPCKYTEEQLLKILLDPTLDSNLVRTSWPPVDVISSATFVINVTQLPNPGDVKKDMFGKWNHSGSHKTPYHIAFGEDGEIVVEKSAPGADGDADGDDVVYLRRLHTSHPSNPEFHQVLDFLSG